MKVVKYILGILFIFTSLGAIAQGAFLAFLFLMILGVALLPPISDLLKEKFKLWQSKGLRYVTYVVLFFIVGVFIPKEMAALETTNMGSKKDTVEDVTAIEDVKERIEEESVINYKIEKETVIRFDKAPSYFVLIDKVDLSNNKFKEGIKNLINKIVAENGAKINIEIIDDKNTLEIMYKSHYGVNTLGRILNKSEIGQLGKHVIASFSGELGTDYQAYFNTLYFFPSASKESSEIRKYVETIEYDPMIKDDRLVKRQREELENQNKQLDKKKEDFEKNCFSAWDGYNRELVKLVKNKMNDKKSFEHVDTSYTLLDDYAIVVMEFRGKNSFGALVMNSVKAKISYDCEVLEIIE